MLESMHQLHYSYKHAKHLPLGGMGLGQVAIYHLALRMVLCMLRPLHSPIHIRCHEAFFSINLCI